ncbi:MAG TPA: choloylglycine hydrolase family protein [Xanthobacteraceae bacterium]
MLRALLVGTVSAALCWAPVAQACTGIRLVAKDGGVVAARTLEFGLDLHSEVLVVPAGTTLTGTLPDGGKGISYKSKYGFLGANAEGLTAIVDGINERGLYVGLFYFPGYASYADLTKDNTARAMAPHEYANWLLGNFSSVEEVKANFNNVVLVPTVLEAIEAPAPVHFVVHDASGAAVVIEPIGKTLKIYDNPLGVVTNAPTFDWHMTNLRNYVNLTVDNVPPIDLGGIKLAQFGQGSGLRGLPGDFTPPSRFVRAVAFSQSALKSDTAPQAVLQAFHILNNFDIPYGAVRDTQDGAVTAEVTIWTSASDLKNRRWYFKTFNNQSIRAVDLEKALAAAQGKIRLIEMDQAQPIIDVSTSFK